jgi:hypothetical protein
LTQGASARAGLPIDSIFIAVAVILGGCQIR